MLTEIIVKRKAKPIHFIRKTISIKREQEHWIKKNNVNLSRFVQSKIDDERRK